MGEERERQLSIPSFFHRGAGERPFSFLVWVSTQRSESPSLGSLLPTARHLPWRAASRAPQSRLRFSLEIQREAVEKGSYTVRYSTVSDFFFPFNPLVFFCLFFLQLRFSDVLVKWRRFFDFLAAQQGKEGVGVLEQRLELEPAQVEDFIFICLLL